MSTDTYAAARARIAELRALVEAGTPGPWASHFISESAVASQHIIDRWYVMGCFDGNPKKATGPAAMCEYEPDALLTIAAVNLLPAALDMAEGVLKDRHAPVPAFVGVRWICRNRCTDEEKYVVSWPCPDAAAVLRLLGIEDGA